MEPTTTIGKGAAVLQRMIDNAVAEAVAAERERADRAEAALAALEIASLSLARLTMTAERVVALRENCHANYSGGHHTDGCHDAFHHGMDTACNVLAAWVSAPTTSGSPAAEE